jgi:hypothetical protein
MKVTTHDQQGDLSELEIVQNLR